MSKKTWPILYSKLLYEIGQDCDCDLDKYHNPKPENKKITLNDQNPSHCYNCALFRGNIFTVGQGGCSERGGTQPD